MENEKFQDLVLEHMARLTQEITEVKSQVSSLDSKVSSLDSKVSSLDSRVVKIETVIENDIALKFEVLFDGQKLMTEQMNRIEKKLDQHDEIIFRRIK